VSLHEPVLVGVRIRNTGPGPVTGDLGFNRKGHFVLTVTAQARGYLGMLRREGR